MSAPLSADDTAFVRSLILHEDDDLIAFAKPPGLTSQGGRIAANTLDDLLAAFARSNGKRPRLVHRLDRDTSGVIVAAKTRPAAAFLGKAMMSRAIQRPISHWLAAGRRTLGTVRSRRRFGGWKSAATYAWSSPSRASRTRSQRPLVIARCVRPATRRWWSFRRAPGGCISFACTWRRSIGPYWEMRGMGAR